MDRFTSNQDQNDRLTYGTACHQLSVLHHCHHLDERYAMSIFMVYVYHQCAVVHRRMSVFNDLFVHLCSLLFVVLRERWSNEWSPARSVKSKLSLSFFRTTLYRTTATAARRADSENYCVTLSSDIANCLI